MVWAAIIAAAAIIMMATTATASSVETQSTPSSSSSSSSTPIPQQPPTAPVFYSLDTFLETFAKIKTSIFGASTTTNGEQGQQQQQGYLLPMPNPFALSKDNIVDNVDNIDIESTKNALTELLTPAQFAQLSLELTPVCRNHPELFVTTGNYMSEATKTLEQYEQEEQLALAARKNLFNTIYPNTVIYTVTNLEDVIKEEDQQKNDQSALAPATPAAATPMEEEDSIEIRDVNENGEEEAPSTPAPAPTPAPTPTPTLTSTPTNKKKIHYEFRFTTTNLEQDLPKFDKQIEQFIAQQEDIQRQRHQLAVRDYNRMLESHRNFMRAVHPDFKPSKAREEELAAAARQQNEEPNITKLGWSRSIKYSQDELAIKFNNFNNILVAVCEHDQYRTVAEKRNVIAHAQLDHEIKQLQWKQLQVEELLLKQNEDVKVRAVKAIEQQKEQEQQKEKKEQQPQPQQSASSTEAAKGPTPQQQQQQQRKSSSSNRRSNNIDNHINRIFDDFENQFNLFQHRAMQPSLSLWHPQQHQQHIRSPFRFTQPMAPHFPTISFW